MIKSHTVLKFSTLFLALFLFLGIGRAEAIIQSGDPGSGDASIQVSPDGGVTLTRNLNVDDGQSIDVIWGGNYSGDVSTTGRYNSSCGSGTFGDGGETGDQQFEMSYGCQPYRFEIDAYDASGQQTLDGPSNQMISSDSANVSVNPPQGQSANFTSGGSQENSYAYITATGPTAMTAGDFQPVDSGFALTGIGYGSDDHKCVVKIRTAPVLSDGSIDFSQISGWQTSSSCAAGYPSTSGGTFGVNRAQYEEQIDYNPGIFGLSRNYVVVGWSWGANTSGGVAYAETNDSWPPDECYYQEYMNLNSPAIHSGWNDPNNGTCDDRDYSPGALVDWSGDLKKVMRAPYEQVIVATDFNIDEDAKLDAMGEVVRPVHPEIHLDSSSFNFSGIANGTNPSSQTLNISNSGWGQRLNWSSSISYSGGASGWLSLGTGSGVIGPKDSPTGIALNVNTSGIAAGNYTATITFSDPNAMNTNNTQVTVNLTVTGAAGGTDLSADQPVVNFTDGTHTQISHIDSVVRNNGSVAASSPFQSNIQVDTNNDGNPDISIQQTLSSLAGNGSVNLIYYDVGGQYAALTPGTYRTRECTDTGNAIAETDETNNCSSPWESFTLNNGSPTAPSGWVQCNSLGIGVGCSISSGSSATISWQSTNTDSCTISPTGWTGLSNAGRSTGALTTTTTYTMTCHGTDNSTYTANVTVTVTGAPPPTQYSVTVAPATGGSVKSVDTSINCGATCSASYAKDSVVTLQAYPASSYWKFNGWSGDCTGFGFCTLTVNGAKNVSASFVPRLFNYIEF